MIPASDHENRPTGVYLRVDGARARALYGKALSPAPRRRSALLTLLESRLSYERQIAAALDAIVGRHGTEPSLPGGPSRTDLEHLRDDELRLVDLLVRAVVELGGDARGGVRGAIDGRRGADLTRLRAILDDPRGGLEQALDALAAVEQTASDGWMILADLMAESGRHELAASFTRAMTDQDRHVETLRGWHRRLAGRARTRRAA